MLVRATHPVYGTQLVPLTKVLRYPDLWTLVNAGDGEPGDAYPGAVNDTELEAKVAALVGKGGAFDVAQRAASVAAVKEAIADGEIDVGADNTMLYVGTRTAPITNPNTARPDVPGPVYWMCAAGVVPANATVGDPIWNAAA